MSLLRLLAAGRSLIGVRETPNAYRMRTANLLPKFGSPKNPFAPKPKTGATDAEPSATPTASSSARPVPVKAETVKMDTIPLFDAKPIAPLPAPPVPAPVKVVEARPVAAQPAITAPAQSQPARVAAAVPARKPLPLAAWAKKLNPLQYLPVREPGVKKSARPRGARAPVQAELSLEKVKVVRNDLSDTDLEVIQAKPAGLANGAGPMFQSMTRTEPANWNRMTSNALGAGQTMIR